MLVVAVLPPARRPAHRSCEALRIPLPTTVAASANSTNARSCVQLAGKLPVGGQRHPQVHQSRAAHIVQRGQKHVHADRCRIRRQDRLLCCQVGRNINSKPTSTRQHTVPERGPSGSCSGASCASSSNCITARVCEASETSAVCWFSACATATAGGKAARITSAAATLPRSCTATPTISRCNCAVSSWIFSIPLPGVAS